MTWYERIIAAHTDVTDQVSHITRMSSERYFVWQEDGRNDLGANNRHAESAVTGSTDLFTKMEFDPWVDSLGESLSSHGVAWALNSIQYEEETGFYHYEWNWEVLGDGEDHV